jgi:gamma-glutamyltranspeptidase/glutathione hydrolase
MVTARHPLAAEAGRRTLRHGGNALDAAVTAILATGVVCPYATTIGGGGLVTVWRPESSGGRSGGRGFTSDFRSEAPAAADLDAYRPRGGGTQDVTPGYVGWRLPGGVNETGHRAVAVPGSIPGLTEVHGRLGRLPWAEVVQPAIDLAERGVEVDWCSAVLQGAYLDLLLRHETTAATFLRDGRYPHRPAVVGRADVWRQPVLAATLREIAEGGASGYRHGAAGRALTAEMHRHAGLVTGADLDGYAPREAPVRQVRYRGHTVVGPAHGGVYDLMLSVLDRLDLAGHGIGSARRLHLLAEALRRCRWVEEHRLGDGSLPPDTAREAKAIAASIDPHRRDDGWKDEPWARHGAGGSAGRRGSEATAHVCAADSSGMVVSLTETILASYGSGVTTTAGVLLNNAMFAFVPVAGHANALRPGHRPQSSMSPVVVLDPTGRAVLAAGASGGPRISAAVVQIVCHVLDHGLSAQDAVAWPRIDVTDDLVLADPDLPRQIAAELAAYGHRVQHIDSDLSDLGLANPSLIARDVEGAWAAGLSPRHQTAAAGW